MPLTDYRLHLFITSHESQKSFDRLRASANVHKLFLAWDGDKLFDSGLEGEGSDQS